METPLARLLHALDDKFSDLAAHVHPDWLAPLGLGFADAPFWRERAPRRSALLMQAFGLSWPALSDFRSRVHRLAVISRDDVLRVLALAAVLPRRDALRRLIGRAAHARLVTALGASAYEQLMEEPPGESAAESPSLTLGELDPQALAVDGYARLGASGLWRCRFALTATRLCLPSEEQAVARPARTADSADALMSRMPHYFPEVEWLFGSDMDRALSA